MHTLRVLTGIKPSGTPHLGNYVGAIRPALRSSALGSVDAFYFLADYHALISTHEPERVQRSTLEIAATWLACGLDPERVTFYRQSDIPETTELTWLLTCVCGKGLLNRAHAYKAALDKNAAAGLDADDGVSAGLFMYPVLMAADILLFNAHQVPVGRDQVQHIEMARDLGSSFNHLYGTHFTLPEAVVEAQVATLPGLDGRKMSKSYDNTIPLFAPPEQLKKLIFGIVTDSLAPGQPKQTEGSALFQLYQAFASADETAALARAYAQGIAWAQAKQLLYERIEAEIAPLRARYLELMARPQDVEALLQAGAAKARRSATPFTQRLRHAVGLRPLVAAGAGAAARANGAAAALAGGGGTAAPTAGSAPAAKAALPVFKQYREPDGRFAFKLADARGQLLLQSLGFATPQEAGQAIARLKAAGYSASPELHPLLQLGAQNAGAGAAQAADAALAALREAG
ncbi:MAG: tryptophan--tRNA ligase [Pseudomonadota bacterium]|jgi:tryptophanyl-tRNA synthetase